MKRGFPGAICCLLLMMAAAAPLTAQLAAPNAAGVSLGAVYYTVPDVAAHRKIWVDIFGARPTMVGKTEMLKLPGVFIVLTQGTPQSGNPLINHLGIWAKDLNPTRAKLLAAGVQNATPGSQFVDLPNALRLEFIDDPAGPDAPAAHHIHYFVANAQDGTNGRAWYMKAFGAAENSRRNGGVPSALLTPPDKWISIDFTAAGGRGGGGGRGGRGGGAPGGAAGAPGGAPAAAPPATPPPAAAPAPAAAGPTSNKGTILDRFALEVKGIEGFVKKLESEGVKVTKPVSTNADGLKTAMIVDGVGNDVELVEGLAGK